MSEELLEENLPSPEMGIDKETLSLIKKHEAEMLKILGGDKSRLSKIGEALPKHEFISTGCYSVDKIMGGGLAKGGLYIFVGPKGASKSTFLAWCFKQFVDKVPDKVNLLLDYEGGVDPTFWNYCGLDSSKMQMVSPETTEQGVDILRATIVSGLYGLVGIDSITAMSPKEEQEKKADEASMTQNARIFSRNLKIIKQYAKRTGTVVVMIAQERTSIGSYSGGPQTAANGNSAEYYADAIFRFTKTSNSLTDKGKIVGLEIQVKNKDKNRFTTPFQTALFNLMYPHKDPDTGKITAGVDFYDDLISSAQDKEILNKGNWIYLFKDTDKEQKWNGKPALSKALKADPALYTLLKDLVYATSN